MNLPKRLNKRMVVSAILLVFICGSVYSAHAEDNDLTTAGDVLAVALPLAAFGGTYLYDDPEGRSQFLKSIVTSTTTVYLMKEAISKIPGQSHISDGIRIALKRLLYY